jgi:protein-S-isoprenylcysteine O-methyltransferase Ste14
MALREEMELHGNWLFRYRSILPLFVLFFGFGVFIISNISPSDYFLINPNKFDYYLYLCLFVSLFGLFIRVFTVGYTPNRTSGRNVKQQVADTLNTSGIYSIVRHPLYLGNFFMWLGPILLTGNFWFVLVICLFYWVYYERIMFAEESFLRRKFGEKYIQWASNVPAFIPKFRGYIKPEIEFNWKKVLKKEKNGLVAVFIIFCLFDLINEYFTDNMDFNVPLISLCGISIIYYLVIKILRKRTEVLN